MGSDYLTKKDADFEVFFKFLCQYVNTKCGPPDAPQWSHISADVLAALNDEYTAWHRAYLPTIGPHTPVDTEAKNDAKKAAKKAIRAFVNQYLRFLPVTDEDHTAMGIPNHDTHPTPGPAPEDVPETEVQMPLPRVLRFRFRRANMKRWGKPKDVHGMELLWLISDTPPTEVEELVHSAFATKSPLELTFKESDRGKRLYYAARWETGTVKKGKCSEIFSVFIP